MEKPIIGVLATTHDDIDGDFQVIANPEIIRWIYKMGGIPKIIFPPRDCSYVVNREVPPMTEEEIEDFDRLLSDCSGFIKAGGYTISDYHKYVYDYCVKNDIPFLGICAGIQLMAAVSESDAKFVVNENIDLHKSSTGATHAVIINPKAKLYNILDTTSMIVKSSHKRHIENVDNLLVAAISSDNQVEALENPRCTYNIGLQWHPERCPFDDIYSARIFKSFVDSAIEYQKENRERKVY